MYKTVIKNRSFPPRRESDLLWFLSNYAKMEDWEADVLQIIREESFYFYPQYLTKIMNEGFASFMHAELMYLAPEDQISHAEYLEFVKIHERVVQPGNSKLNINPYFLGFTILNNIKAKWDKLHEKDETEMTGMEKIFDVVRTEDDISFLRGYLTQEICDDLHLFAYTKRYDKKREEYIQVESKKAIDVVEHMISELYNYRSPVISIVHASHMGLELEHDSIEIGGLDPKHTRQVMKYLFNTWNGTIDLKTANKKGEVFHYTYDEAGFSHHDDDEDLLPASND
jgi:stage V sporulation protein R